MTDVAAAERTETANERFKRRFGDTVWASVCIAVAVHVAVLALFPSMSVADMGIEGDPIEAIVMPPEIVIPPPPEQIAQPATPVISDVAPLDVTIADTKLDTNPLDRPLAPPPVTKQGTAEQRRVPYFTPMTVIPELKNRAEVERELERRYPRILKESGIGGAPAVLFYIDEAGTVEETRLAQSSGYPALDEAALAVGRIMRFSPALNQDRKVAVWVTFPVRFESK
jgi:periplasmic protein TonB